MTKQEIVDTLERHANILRSIRLMAKSRPLSQDENRMMAAAIDDLDAIAVALYPEVEGQ